MSPPEMSPPNRLECKIRSLDPVGQSLALHAIPPLVISMKVTADCGHPSHQPPDAALSRFESTVLWGRRTFRARTCAAGPIGCASPTAGECPPSWPNRDQGTPGAPPVPRPSHAIRPRTYGLAPQEGHDGRSDAKPGQGPHLPRAPRPTVTVLIPATPAPGDTRRVTVRAGTRDTAADVRLHPRRRGTTYVRTANPNHRDCPLIPAIPAPGNTRLAHPIRGRNPPPAANVRPTALWSGCFGRSARRTATAHSTRPPGPRPARGRHTRDGREPQPR
jgi:hypothetical protein